MFILIGADHLAKGWIKNWNTLAFNAGISLLENTGITDAPEVKKTLENCHLALQKIYREELQSRGNILDIGCGPGLFLDDFRESKDGIWGIDMNPDFVSKARENLPMAHILEGNFLNKPIPEKFKLIFSSSVLMYIERSAIKLFFDKIYDLLETDGIVFIHYPHALQLKDILYHDLSYIRYSPAFLEKIIGKKFRIIKHEHMYDGHKVGRFDKVHYYYPNGKKDRLDTLQNTFMLIAKKKDI
jgi:SAM-dependent methyltransferase